MICFWKLDTWVFYVATLEMRFSPFPKVSFFSVFCSGSHFSRWECAVMTACFCVCTPVIRSSSQHSVHRFLIFEEGGPYCAPWLPQTIPGTTSCSKVEGTGKWVTATMLREKMTGINQGLPSKPCPRNWKPSNRLQSSKIVTSNRFCQCNCCLGGETDSWGFPSHHHL